MEDGAWECGVCGQVNAGWAHKCGRCDLPRPIVELDPAMRDFVFGLLFALGATAIIALACFATAAVTSCPVPA